MLSAASNTNRENLDTKELLTSLQNVNHDTIEALFVKRVTMRAEAVEEYPCTHERRISLIQDGLRS